MQQNISLPFDQFANAMVKIGALGSPSGLHGWLTGYLASGARLNNAEWQREAEQYLETPEALPAAVQSLMTVFYGWVLQGLQDESMSFKLFLPDEDDAEFAQRVDALADWSKGFLDGFGAAGKVQQLDDEVQEVLQHFDAFSQASADEEDDVDEGMLLELVEHARVMALTVFLAFNEPLADGEKPQVLGDMPADLTGQPPHQLH
jgi:uncharacterized protein YgfB (UPF0149 family)